jgi:hypothetical protein
VLKFVRTVVSVAVLLCWSLSGGVAVADAPNLEDVTDQFEDTPDGLWRLHVSLRNMNITSVPNMAATAFTREAFVSATAEVWVEALHPDDTTPAGADVTHRMIELWLEAGCQVNLGVTQLQANNTSSPGLSDTNSTGTNGAGASTGTSNSLNPSVGQAPQQIINEALTSGAIERRLLQRKAYPDVKANQRLLQNPPAKPDEEAKAFVGPGWSNDKLIVAVRNWDLKVDSCAGPVSFRFQAAASMRTPRFDDIADAYSAIVQV